LQKEIVMETAGNAERKRIKAVENEVVEKKRPKKRAKKIGANTLADRQLEVESQVEKRRMLSYLTGHVIPIINKNLETGDICALAESFYPLIPKDTINKIRQSPDALVVAIKKNCLNVARILARDPNELSKNRLELSNVFLVICGYGYLEMAQWLADYIQLTADDAKKYTNYGFHKSCENGHLAIAQWLAERFQVTANDARTYHNYAFIVICENGHLAVAMWLVERFQLTADATSAEINEAFCRSCKNGHLAVAMWLVERFQLTDKDAMAYNDAFRRSCEKGHLAVAQWLAEHFQLTAADARAYGNYALIKSRENGHLDVENWLVKRFRL
jgi:hypothetical protein